MHSLATRLESLQLIEQGMSPSEVSRKTGIARSTIRDWVKNPRPKRIEGDINSRIAQMFSSIHQYPEAYAYALAFYLGDGYIDKLPRTYRLRIFNDVKYPDITQRIRNCLSHLLPRNVVAIQEPSAGQGHENVSVIRCHSTILPVLFPQHGPGKKHTRSLILLPWQEDIVDSWPQAFLRGLIESDGCRYRHSQMRNGRLYEYDHYAFSNQSKDLLRMAARVCERLGVRYTCPPLEMGRGRCLYIRHSRDVEFLDSFIGPKS